MGWYATRSVYHFGKKKNGLNVFEERIVCFEAADFDEANHKAAHESKVYAQDNNFRVHCEQLTYKQDGEGLIDGYELWSELFGSSLSLGEFYQEHYLKYVYNPDEDGVFVL